MKWRCCLVSLICAMLMLGCSGQAATPSATNAPAPSTTSLPSTLHGVVPDEPLMPLGSVEGADYLFVSATVSEGDVGHAYLIGFRDNDKHVFHVTITDGLATVDPADPGVDALDLDLEHPGPMPTSIIQQEDGVWVMYGFGVPSSIGATPIFWRAVSDSPSGPWRDPTIVFEVGGPGAWDGAWIDFPTVSAIQGEMSMLYEGASDAEPNASHLGIASSPDGVEWSRPESPSVSPESCRDVVSIRMPRLLQGETGWLLAFSAITGGEEEPPIRLAMGQDPLAPSCADAEVAFSADDLPSSGGIHSHALIQTESGPALLVESLNQEASGSSVWLVPLVG